MDQNNLSKNLTEFSDRSRPRTSKGKDKTGNLFKNVNGPYESREWILNSFRSGIFPIKETLGKGLEILTPKQMLQRLPIAFV